MLLLIVVRTNLNFSSFKKFLEQQYLKGECEVAISEVSYPSLYQNVSEKKFTFIDGREGSEEAKINRFILKVYCIQVLLI